MILGYIRVSTEDQAREGVSLDAQAERIHAYCQAHGLVLGEIIRDEGISGTVSPDKRPGLSRALSLLASKQADGLVVLRLDRLTRSIRDLLDLVDVCRRETWSLHSVTDRLDTASPMGMFVLTILGAVAQLERDMISTRTREALQHKVRQGAKLGNAPYGWRKVRGPDGKMTQLVDFLPEQVIRLRIWGMAQLGASHQKIADTLNSEGILARRGPWSRRGVQCVLNQPETSEKL